MYCDLQYICKKLSCYLNSNNHKNGCFRSHLAGLDLQIPYFLTLTLLPQFFFVKYFLYLPTLDFLTLTVLIFELLRDFFTPFLESLVVFLILIVLSRLSFAKAYVPILDNTFDVMVKDESFGHLANAFAPIVFNLAPPDTFVRRGHP